MTDLYPAGSKNERDFEPIEQTFLFSDTTSKTVTVTIYDDKHFEEDETFFAILSVDDSIKKAVMFSPNNATFTILNDDSKFYGWIVFKP